MLRQAVGGSSSAPFYFNPLEFVNKYNISNEFIDGGIICNNPAFYAYLLAKHIKGIKDDLRIISLGTGIALDKNIDLNNPKSFNKYKSS